MTSGLSLVQRIERAGVRHIADDTARDHGITLGEMLSTTRRAPIVDARRAFYAALRIRGTSYPRIAWLVGKDHQTIMHALGATKSRYVRGSGRRRAA